MSSGTQGLQESFVRLICYMATVLAYMDRSILQIVHRHSLGDIFYVARAMMQLISDSVCCNCSGLHLVRAREDTSNQRLVDLVAKGDVSSDERNDAECSPSRDDYQGFLSRDTRYAAVQEVSSWNLPRQLGGDYDYGLWDEWICSHLSIEEIMAAAAPVRNGELTNRSLAAMNRQWQQQQQQQYTMTTTSTTTTTSSKLTLTTNDNRKSTTPEVQRLHNESARNFARRRSNFYSKRSKEKSNNQHQAMYYEKQKLLKLNQALKMENERLQVVLETAQSIVEQYQEDVDIMSTLQVLQNEWNDPMADGNEDLFAPIPVSPPTRDLISDEEILYAIVNADE